jgi:hypothetical protein
VEHWAEAVPETWLLSSRELRRAFGKYSHVEFKEDYDGLIVPKLHLKPIPRQRLFSSVPPRFGADAYVNTQE